jgi:hypothetical protein
MKLSIRGLMFTTALLWGGCILCVGMAHLAFPNYASHFLAGISSIYPGFHGGRSFGDVIVGTAYALVDGGLGGLFFGWLYNLFSSRQPEPLTRS